jgi:hypothetical protein
LAFLFGISMLSVAISFSVLSGDSVSLYVAIRMPQA